MRNLLAAILVVCLAAPARGASSTRLGRSVVQIFVSIQQPNYAMPWQSPQSFGATGSGFIVAKRRILTNAHVVSNAGLIEVQKEHDATRYVARVLYIGHDCDLALLTVDDERFFSGTSEAELARVLPGLNDEVLAIGYPVGGNRVSVTRGVVSRIDYSVYSHSGVDAHLVLQVDAAINPGNSGGPVVFRDKVVGVAFQGLTQAENIGYAIPVPVIERFLSDVADGKYNGYPELGLSYMSLRNAALRDELGIPSSEMGVAVQYVDPFGSAWGRLQNRDALLAVDGHAIDHEGAVTLDGTKVEFAELLERKQWGDAVTFKVWRDRKEHTIEVPLTNPRDPFAYRNLYDERPRYLILGGLVFAPLSRDYLRTLESRANSCNGHLLIYYSQYVKVDGLHKNRDELVVLIARLPHPVNTYDAAYQDGLVESMNGRPIRCLADIKAASATPQGGFHLVRFAGRDDTLVMDAVAAAAAEKEIMSRYAIEHYEWLGDIGAGRVEPASANLGGGALDSTGSAGAK